MLPWKLLVEQTKVHVQLESQKSFQKDPWRVTGGFGDGVGWLVTGKQGRGGRGQKEKNPTAEKTVCY